MSLIIHRNGDRPSRMAPAEYFTGTVLMTPIVQAPEPASLRALSVTFAPGARTNWHTHPLGQTLHVTSGQGLIALRDGAPEVIRAGDTVYIPPEVEHWHGAGPETAMTHIAMQEEPEAETTWLDPVSDADYAKS
ncbi:(R)-mandelonitrile lyase [Pontivivens ytuae]|uniref:Cupin domain-containing protein n=1 Tax=Pontivivens ytuae TaxID=2789856 RepID=A0A7S9QDP4_9RHOB|nr:cupin domain-containing protein [Pontivivens ytuae]QPH55488.1 cupin domain-containing protein [Pontivivens ytuae]